MDKKDILISYISWIVCFLLCMLVGIYKTYALTFSNFQYIQNNTNLLVGYANSGNPISWPYNNSGLYQENITILDYVISNVSISANVHYEFESRMLSQRIIGSPTYTVTGLNGESCLTDSYYLNFINSEYPRWDFQCPHSTDTFTIHIYQPNNSKLFNSGTMGWGSAILSQTTEPISSTNNDTEEIINNQNKNANDIIDNQNKNTQDIINSNKVCSLIDKSNISTDNSFISGGNGSIISNSSNYGYTDYIDITGGSIETLIDFSVSSSSSGLCFYNINKSLISCVYNINLSIGTLSIPDNSSFVRFSINKSLNEPQFKVCINGQQANNNTSKGILGKLKELFNLFNSDDIGDSADDGADFINGFNTNTFGLTSIISAPLTLIQSLTSSSCTALHLPLPYLDNKYLDLPCMSSIYSTYFGTFFTLYQTITYGIIAYWVCVRIFNQVKDFKNPEHDEIEVLDL